MASKVYYAKIGKRESLSGVSDRLALLIRKSGVLNFIKKNDFTAIKLHFGDEGNTGHIRAEWIAESVRHVKRLTGNAFLTDTNVIYKAGRRTNTVEHLKIAAEHGFSLEKIGVPVIIADGLRGRNFVEIAVEGKHFKSIKLASDFADSDGLLAMTHVTGHIMTGIGGAIKNIGMGCSSRRGKYEQHCGTVPELDPKHCVSCGRCVAICPAGALRLNPKISINKKVCFGCGECAVICKTKAIEIRWSETLENLQEKMVEYAKGTINALNGKLGYVNFLIKVTKDCDCLAKDDPRIVHDLGILASMDPVAIDKASADLLKEAAGSDILKAGYPETDWLSQLKYAASMGLGNLEYTLEEV